MEHLRPNLSKLEYNLCMIIDLLIVHGWLRPIVCFTSSRDSSRSGSRFSFNVVFISCLLRIGNQKRSSLSSNQIFSDKRLDRTKILSTQSFKNWILWSERKKIICRKNYLKRGKMFWTNCWTPTLILILMMKKKLWKNSQRHMCPIFWKGWTVLFVVKTINHIQRSWNTPREFTLRSPFFLANSVMIDFTHMESYGIINDSWSIRVQ